MIALRRPARTWGAAAMVSAVGLVACGAGAAVGGTAVPSPPTNAAATATSTSVPAMHVAAMTPLDASRISAAERAAIVALGASGAGGPSSVHAHGHDPHADHVEVPLFNGDAVTFANQWLAAQRAADGLDTTARAAALGYVRASSPGSGIGTHWVLWSQIGKPFDPAHPAMLLFDERKTPAVLVGFSYWLQSATQPVGFAGGNDEWHQHSGLCVVNGWVDREEASGPDQCAGTFLAGGDLWMLHAWVVPRFANRHGRFATFNRMLCPPNVGTPDISRCPD